MFCCVLGVVDCDDVAVEVTVRVGEVDVAVVDWEIVAVVVGDVVLLVVRVLVSDDVAVDVNDVV